MIDRSDAIHRSADLTSRSGAQRVGGRLRVLEEEDGCRSPGEIGRLPRREGLYSSHLANWRKARRNLHHLYTRMAA